MSRSSSPYLLLSLASLVSGLMALAVEITLLIVALGPVQKHRPDAAMLLAGSAGASLLATAISYPVSFLVPAFFGASAYGEILPLMNLGLAFVRAAAGVMLLLGIYRLALPATYNDPTRYA